MSYLLNRVFRVGILRSFARVAHFIIYTLSILGLPESMQEEVARFFERHENWIKELLEYGISSGDFAKIENVDIQAKLMLSAIQGALVIARTRHDNRFFFDVVESIRTRLKK